MSVRKQLGRIQVEVAWEDDCSECEYELCWEGTTNELPEGINTKDKLEKWLSKNYNGEVVFGEYIDSCIVYEDDWLDKEYHHAPVPTLHYKEGEDKIEYICVHYSDWAGTLTYEGRGIYDVDGDSCEKRYNVETYVLLSPAAEQRLAAR